MLNKLRKQHERWQLMTTSFLVAQQVQGHPTLFVFLIWLKMTLKWVVHMKTRRFHNHKDPPFDMKHQLMSADPLPVIKIDLK